MKFTLGLGIAILVSIFLVLAFQFNTLQGGIIGFICGLIIPPIVDGN